MFPPEGVSATPCIVHEVDMTTPPTSLASIDAERAAFEEYARRYDIDTTHAVVDDGRTFASSETEHAWQFWQASRRHLPEINIARYDEADYGGMKPKAKGEWVRYEDAQEVVARAALPSPANTGEGEIHLAWRGALKACGVSEADRDAITEVVRSMLPGSAPTIADERGESYHRIPGLGFITDEDNGRVTLEFKDEASATRFMKNYGPSVDCDAMPPRIELRAPIDMVLHCPNCGRQHIDAPDERTPNWKNEPHRSHLCHYCAHIWRPADVPTNGVQAVKTAGKADRSLTSTEKSDDWLPIEQAPSSELVVVGWLDAEDEANPERHDFDYLEDGVWQKHSENVEYFQMCAPAGSRGPKEQPPYTHFMRVLTLPAAPKAAEKSGMSE